MSNVATIEREPNPVEVARTQLTKMEDQFKAALPAHIPVERFARVVMTAIQNNGTLLKVERRSLWNAAMRAAQDGLLPDGRDGAIVEYKGNAQWMPMIGGLRKKARNSGEILTWEAHVVCQNDEFVYELGDEPFIRHKPAFGDRGPITHAYSIATLKDGYKSREVMSIAEIEGVRTKSKAQNGPWKDPVFYPEMVRKTVARRHSKVLPMSSDLDDLIRRDDDLYDLQGVREETHEHRPHSLSSALDKIAALPVADGPTIDHAGTEEPVGLATDATGGETRAEIPQAPEPQDAIPNAVSDPEAFLKWADDLLTAATTVKAFNQIKSNMIETRTEGIFPPDRDALDKIYGKHRERL